MHDSATRLSAVLSMTFVHVLMLSGLHMFWSMIVETTDFVYQAVLIAAAERMTLEASIVIVMVIRNSAR